MAKVTKGLFTVDDTLSEYIQSIAEIPQSVQKDMLKAEAAVIVDAQKDLARSMLTEDGGYGASGKHTDVINGIVGNIKQGRIKKSSRNSDVLRTDVIIGNKQHGERLAAIAFMNEYGVVHKPTKFYPRAYRQPARPFISRSVLYFSHKAVEAAAEVFKKFLNNR